MPVKFWQTSIRFWFFLSYLITTVQLEQLNFWIEHTYTCGLGINTCCWLAIKLTTSILLLIRNYIFGLCLIFINCKNKFFHYFFFFFSFFKVCGEEMISKEKWALKPFFNKLSKKTRQHMLLLFPDGLLPPILSYLISK